MNIKNIIITLAIIFSWNFCFIYAEELQQNKLEDYYLKKQQKTVSFHLQNPYDKPYLWIMAHAWDLRELEHGGGHLQIKVNGIVLDKEKSILQGNEYNCPFHPKQKNKTKQKYDAEKQSWIFKYDNDFVMNNGCGDKGVYTTLNLNHWYAFDLKDIARKGDNEITVTDCVESDRWKTYFYGGFSIGELGIFSLNEIKEKIKKYNSKKQGPKQRLVLDEPKFPKGQAQEIKIKDGYIVKNGKPFIQLVIQSCSNTETGPRNMLYFNWGNVLQLSPFMVDKAAEGRDYLSPKWNKQKISAFIPKYGANVVYSQDFLCDWRYASFNLNTTFMPNYIANKIPVLYAIDSRGQYCKAGVGKFPNLGSPLYKKYIAQIIALLGSELKGHPAGFANSAHEELRWRCYSYFLPPQDKASIKRYRKVLEKKYSDIKNLNNEWETDYKTFEDIKPPKTREQSANFVNFQIFRAQILQDFSEVLYTSLKKAFPDLPVTGERSGVQWSSTGWRAGESWFLNSKWTDIRTVGGGGMALARSAQRYYKKMKRNFALQNDICFICQYKYVNRPYSAFWEPPHLKDIRGMKISPKNFFNMILHDVFEGSKCSFFYSYDADRAHLLHNQARYSKANVEVNYNKTEIDLSKLKGLPDIIIPESSLRAGDANGLCYKLSPLLLPGKLDKGKLVLLYTRRSSLIGWQFGKILKGQEGGHITRLEWSYLQNLLEHMHMPFEVETEDSIAEELDKYKVLIAGYWTTMGNKEMADKIKDFVANGNVAIFYPDAFCYDWNTAKDLKNSPGYGLDKLFGARIKKRIFGKEKTIKILEDISPSLKKGDVFQVRGLVTPLEKLEGGKVVAELADTGEPVIISANDGRTYYIGFVPGISYSSEMENGRKIRDLFSGMIEKSQIKKPVEIEKTQDSYLVYARMLHGKSYWLVALLNDHWKKQSVQAKLNFLPDGKLYDIIDVSKPGKPVVLKKKQPFETLLKNGINVKLEPLSGRVLIVRPSDMEIFVDCPEYELKALTLKQNINIVLPDNCSENLMDSVKKLQKTLLSKGSRSKILKADEIAIENTSALLKEKKCIIGEFKNKVLKTPDNLIIIGSTENNKLIQTLCKPGNYTYDKVLDDISLDYPGPGRGAIQIAESVNKAYYCPTDKSRDAVLIGGSDETGTVKAIDKFIEILQR